MILVPLGPAQRKEEGGRVRRRRRGRNNTVHQPQQPEREKVRYLQTEKER